MVLAACGKVMHLTSVQPQVYAIQAVPEDPGLVDIIAPYKDSMDQVMNAVIGQCAANLFKDRPEGTLGNWACDAVLSETNLQDITPVDFVVLNYGGLRITELASGPVTLGKIYELMPFDNLVTILEANGEVVQSFVDRMAASGGWPGSATLRYEISGGKAMHVMIGGQPLQDELTYRFVVPDYIANGGDNIDVLEGLPRTDLSLLIRDALISQVKRRHAEGEAIGASLDGRVQKIQ